MPLFFFSSMLLLQYKIFADFTKCTKPHALDSCLSYQPEGGAWHHCTDKADLSKVWMSVLICYSLTVGFYRGGNMTHFSSYQMLNWNIKYIVNESTLQWIYTSISIHLNILDSSCHDLFIFVCTEVTYTHTHTHFFIHYPLKCIPFECLYILTNWLANYTICCFPNAYQCFLFFFFFNGVEK